MTLKLPGLAVALAAILVVTAGVVLLAGWFPLAGSREGPEAAAGPFPRVVSLCSAATEAALALGLAEHLVGVDEHSALPGAGAVPVIASGGRVSAERLLAAKPHLAFAWWYQRGAIEQMERLGIRVTALRAQSADEALELVEAVARACGAAERGSVLASRLRAELAALTEQAPRPDELRPLVYLELHSPFKSCGPGSYAHDLILRAGGRNVAVDAGNPYPMVSSEVLLARQPDVVLLVRAAGAPPEDVASRPGWAGLRAVASRSVHVLPNDLVSPGPRVAEAVRAIRRLLHPGSPAGDASCHSTR